ncbi:DUF6228 family protein [Streptomyces sp. NPDC001594]|uniref:DUF6228 family protein n=1 Tax=Streptomyces sp. NPDC001594 TaxID=3364590 RepID=UPI003682A455
MIEDSIIDGPCVRVGETAQRAVHLVFSEPTKLYGDDPTLDFLVRARGQGVRIETSVRTWSGDGLDTFLSSLAEEFQGWEGLRTWRSLEGDLTLSAEHRSRGYVHLTWGIRPRPPEEDWNFEITTAHAAGEDMRNLSARIATFLRGNLG